LNVSIPPVPAQEIYDYIVGDFESAWGALVAKQGTIARGNFMFALLSMILLEFACRVCAKDATKGKLAQLTKALETIERRYFTPLPGSCCKTNEFILPGQNPDSHLLGMLFDVVRNGKAHQYQSPVVQLCDGDVDIDLTGATPGRALTTPGRRRPAKHLQYRVSSSGDLSLYVRTDQLFLDIKGAIEKSQIISASAVIMDISRPKPPRSKTSTKVTSPSYAFRVADLKNALNKHGHSQGTW
jgi:hypothetical protein